MSSKLLIVDNVKKYFVHGGIGAKKIVRAVDGVSLELGRGETIGLVGESGSGKSTLGRLVLRVYRPTSGRIIFDGVDITKLSESRLRPMRKRMQLVPQDPYASFNPLHTIGDQLLEPVIVHNIGEGEEAREKVLVALEEVGLVPAEEFYTRYPYQLSGGQLQRAAIARAILLGPELLVADEPTSSLDVSIRASILDLLRSIQAKRKMATIFITHDLATAKLVSDKIAVMYLGKIVELGPSSEVLSKPYHPYTAALLTAIPKLSRRKTINVELRGEIPDPSRVPRGCRLHPRCPFAREKCTREEPELVDIERGHRVSCFFPLS